MNLLYQFRNYRSWVRGLLMGTKTPLNGIVLEGRLYATLIKSNGKKINLGLLGKRCVTTAGVNYLRNDFAAQTEDVSSFKYHDCGTGTGADALCPSAYR